VQKLKVELQVKSMKAEPGL